uniref:Ribosomal protein S10 n=1 Tax=Amicula sp. isolate GU52X-4 cfCalB7 TaxID=3003489 RepID=A0A9E8Z2H5_9STRA|nr:ribosomal protein S10 [Amicula sp. isolate GU52X-4 cfCalB7]
MDKSHQSISFVVIEQRLLDELTICEYSLNKFILFFFNALKNKQINIYILKKILSKKKKTKKFAILKSPHIYKSAQEQFEFKFFFKQIKCYSTTNFQFLLFLKKISIFSGVKIKIKLINNTKKYKFQIFNPDNLYSLNFKNVNSAAFRVEWISEAVYCPGS